MTRSAPDGPQRQPGGNAARVRIMGTPRSGTNLAKHLVETHLGVPVVFDQGFWKHGIFPALMSGRDLGYGGLPIIVMSKDPITQLLSWFRFTRNSSIFRPARHLGPFLNRPLEIRQDFTRPGQMEYRFRTPADYWNQFYFAMEALRRTGAPVHFVCYEQLVSTPALCLSSMSRFLDLASPFDAGASVTSPATRWAQAMTSTGPPIRPPIRGRSIPRARIWHRRLPGSDGAMRAASCATSTMMCSRRRAGPDFAKPAGKRLVPRRY